MKIRLKQIGLLLCVALFSSCGAYFNQPFDTQNARIGEITDATTRLKEMPEPAAKAVVGVYKFEDQTGQYKLSEVGSSFSNAVTQGGTTILIKALEDSKWFRTIERENIGNLINERGIILNTRKDYAAKTQTPIEDLPPLLYAGILIEGGIVSYDTNVLTGGVGARYFGAGGSTEYRQDRVTIYLRAVSTQSGEIMKTVYVSKSIYSQAVDANLFRYVSFQRLLEAETGFTRNEPGQLAIKEAIEKAVESLIIEGITVQLWFPKGGMPVAQKMVSDYYKEKEIAERTDVYQREFLERRSKWRADLSAGSTYIKGDLPDASYEYSISGGLKYNLTPNIGVRGVLSKYRLKNTDLLNREFASSDLNLELTVLPYEEFSPYAYIGSGLNFANNFDKTDLKVQAGIGFEYAFSPSFGLTVFGEYNNVFADDLDNLVSGKLDDQYYRFGVGLNVYLGNNKAKENNVARQNRKARRVQKRKEKKALKESLKQDVEGDSLSRKRNTEQAPLINQENN